MKCKFCGGTAGSLIDGAHALCAARKERNLPTPCLGYRCQTCNGHGRIPKTKYGPINPNQAAIDAWAPPCPDCDGKGHTF